MKQTRNIDESLKERLNIVQLLDGVKRESITAGELEEIGASLRRAGKQALQPLLRKIWRETDGDSLSRYAYLLEFFNEHSWLDQLVKIALTRRDLEADGLAALLQALERYGVDVTAPPFTRLLADLGGALRETLPSLLDRGDKGLVVFLEGFLLHQQDVQLAIIRELAQCEHPRVINLFRILLHFDDPLIVAETIATLGRVKSGATALLLACAQREDYPHRELVARSLRRLAFLGAPAVAERKGDLSPLPYHGAWMTPVDAMGGIFICVSRWDGPDTLEMLLMDLHESCGLRDAWGYAGISPEQHHEIFSELNLDGALVQIRPAHAITMIRDAMVRNRSNQTYLPPEFYVRRRIFGDEDLSPADYLPGFEGYNLEALAGMTQLVADSARLLDDPYFQNWFIACRRVYEAAEELERLETGQGGAPLKEAMEAVMDQAFADIVPPMLNLLSRRMFLSADLMIRGGREKRAVRLTLATALSLGRGWDFRNHPFLRRYFLDSLEMAREALAEGYDYREELDPADDGEHWG